MMDIHSNESGRIQLKAMSKKRIIVIGGVAGGASAAARARRLSEDAEIILFEKGPHVSFANCGLPYYLGGEIADEADLLVQTPDGLRKRFNLDVRINTEVVVIDREAQEVEAVHLPSGTHTRERYDALVLSPGANPVKPPIPGIDRPGHFVLRNIPDTLAIEKSLKQQRHGRVVVVGGGYIGLEMAEQLNKRGVQVTLVEALPQVLSPLDPEMASWLHRELRRKGVELHLGDPVVSFDDPVGREASASIVALKSGVRIPADMVVLGIGVSPDTSLAKAAGLEIGSFRGIRVNEYLQTSDPNIWAVGDAIEVRNTITGEWSLVPLAGPANRQGRMAADNIFGKQQKYAGTMGTGILRVFSLVAGMTGSNAKTLKKAGIPFQSIYLHSSSHAGYYPGASTIAMKVLFDPSDGRLLGAQAVGKDGVDKRIDVLATAIKANMTVRDIAQLELSYAPPFGSAKDPVNVAGMMGENILDGLMYPAQWDETDQLDPEKQILLDVRQKLELEEGKIPGAIHIPLPELRSRLSELPKDKEIVVYCLGGQRSYYAERILALNGFKARNLMGAWLTWKAAREIG
jgi:NADPH-dependent 2,4-dienoyl-CoA reductase/sulfur reductase-like enzyme/rhodanese-related sulfurtransferase